MVYPVVQHARSALQQLEEALMSPLASPYMAMPTLQAFLSPPVTTQPYVVPSFDQPQRVSFAQMTPEDAGAALRAMDKPPQFFEAMKADLDHCTQPYSAGYSAQSVQQFIATYGQLVEMPNGLDTATVAALYRMLASPEPATQAMPTRAQATQPQPQTLPFMEMTLEDSRAALQAMEVAPHTLARMTKDLLLCVETQGSRVGPECARQFQHDYGHLLAMPPHLDAAALTTLVNLLMDLPEVQPPVARQVEPHVEPQVQAQAEPHEAPQPDTPAPQATGLALHAMEPDEAMQAPLAPTVTERQLTAMAQDLMVLADALRGENGKDPVEKLAQEFAKNHGQLIELPTPLNADILNEMARMLVSPMPEEE
jgi:hypothetical protein